MIVIFGLTLVQSKFFYVTQIEVEGKNEILQRDIISKLSEFNNKSIVYINTNLLEEEISKDARVKTVIIKKRYPNKLIVELNEREPVAYISKNNELYVVDSDLNIFSNYNEMVNKALPLVYYDEKSEKDITNILKVLIKSNLYSLSSEIYKEDNKYVIILNDGVKIYINNLVDTKKLNQGYIVYNKEKELNNTMDYIDLRFEFISVK
ncbi:FtsQ-type POTRA domain-containing protein [Sneathia sanguinegens]|uniref:FtsQ-type POTRA domain-containing protein n=1 Tax=Sneathia sanguinegens TaxID=40543 RepID=A0ABT7HIF2_9FUSO|nr:FtsQ-type POTRA domain-containing protein [Sneathia sanguinegens]MDK9580289.1 FtsQ-type POTRA domain-containing protein [Sneathia sanguinegens]